MIYYIVICKNSCKEDNFADRFNYNSKNISFFFSNLLFFRGEGMIACRINFRNDL